MITLAGIYFGLQSIVWASTHPYRASVAIILSCVCDLLDGRIARLTGTTSNFGVQLDSLADVVSFGLAPAYLLYHWGLRGWTWSVLDLSLLLCFVYVACAAIRLARFNLDASLQVAKIAQSDDPPKPAKPQIPGFIGFPTPAGALLVAATVMTQIEWGFGILQHKGLLLGILLLTAFAMVSPLPYRSFKNFRTKAGRFIFFGSILSGLTLLIFKGPGGSILFALLLFYLVSGPYGALTQRD